MKVLVVDDTAATRLVLCALLQRAGYEAIAAADADEAVRLFVAEAPQAVLTDLHLGTGGSGLTLVDELRKMNGGEALRIGLMTGDAVSGEPTPVGVDVVLGKPVPLSEIESFLNGGER